MKRSQLSLSDEWETPTELFRELCYTYSLTPTLDVACTSKNQKCVLGYTKETDALDCDWYQGNDVWCNPPHSKTQAFVLKAHEQWYKHNINIIMLVPTGVISRKYFRSIWNNYFMVRKGVEIHPIDRPTFIHPDHDKQKSARNDYIVIIWRSRKE
jgi:phage N-6-adenine-methyltransferase